MKRYLLSFCLLLITYVSAIACTSVIISANRTESGVPLMFKNRDTDCLDNRLAWFDVDSVAFVGLVNAPVDSGEVWAGQNSLGFAVMNTAVYNFDEDSLTADYRSDLLRHHRDSDRLAARFSQVLSDSLSLKKQRDRILADTMRVRYAASLDSLRMALKTEGAYIDSVQAELDLWLDSVNKHPELVPQVPFSDKEGEIMFRALATCATVADFLNLLDTLPHPLGIQANFGVIDAAGGAIYVEANNWRYVVYDVNEEAKGDRVQTNFAFAGDPTKYQGYERYMTAEAAMHDLSDHWTHQPMGIGHQWLFNHLSRSYRHEVLGFPEGYCPPAGVVVDQDFIPQRITSAAVVFEGPAMWTILGYPVCGVAMPAVVCDKDRLPEAMKRTETDSTCLLSNMAMQIKMDHVFPEPMSNGKQYVQLHTILFGKKRYPSLMSCTLKAEKQINAQYDKLYTRWKTGKMTVEQFFSQYQAVAAGFPAIYTRAFRKYLAKPAPMAEAVPAPEPAPDVPANPDAEPAPDAPANPDAEPAPAE